DGLTVPRRLRAGAVGHVQVDVTKLKVLTPSHHHSVRRLDEEYRVDRVEQEARNAVGPAPRSGREPDLPGDHLFIGLSHFLHDPWLQDRIAEVRNLERFRVPGGKQEIANETMGRVGNNGPGPRIRKKKFVADTRFQPTNRARWREIRYGTV